MAEKKFACETCPLRRYSDRRPQSIISRVWRWHTGWCPGWKAYQKSLAETERTIKTELDKTTN
jgi:hypothetical protein